MAHKLYAKYDEKTPNEPYKENEAFALYTMEIHENVCKYHLACKDALERYESLIKRESTPINSGYANIIGSGPFKLNNWNKMGRKEVIIHILENTFLKKNLNERYSTISTALTRNKEAIHPSTKCIRSKIHYIGCEEKDFDKDTLDYISLGTRTRLKPRNKILLNQAKALEIPTKTHKIHETYIAQDQIKEAISKINLNQYTITEADKNMGVCIVKNEKLEELTQVMLRNEPFRRTYKKPNEVIKEYKKDIVNLFGDDNLLGNERIGRFQAIPKVHKNPIKIRPVINMNNIYCTPLGALITEYLKPITQKINEKTNTVVRNTDEMIDELHEYDANKEIEIESFDFEAMYTNIDTRTLTIIMEYIIRRFGKTTAININEKPYLIFPNTGIDMIKIYLKQLAFTHNNETYLQTKGIPMGGKPSTYLANSYGLFFEIKLLESKHKWRKQIEMLKRFIDDILLIKTKNDTKAIDIINAIYSNRIAITQSDKEEDKTVFLDIKMKKERGKITYETYRKPGNAYNYPPEKCYLPMTCKIGFIQGETQRIIRTNREPESIIKNLNFFYTRIYLKGYRSIHIKQAIEKQIKRMKQGNESDNDRRKNVEWHPMKYNHLLDTKAYNSDMIKIAFRGEKATRNIIGKAKQA